MSEPCYGEEYANMLDAAYEQAKMYYEREPTVEEIDEELEALMDRYR